MPGIKERVQIQLHKEPMTPSKDSTQAVEVDTSIDVYHQPLLFHPQPAYPVPAISTPSSMSLPLSTFPSLPPTPSIPSPSLSTLSAAGLPLVVANPSPAPSNPSPCSSNAVLVASSRKRSRVVSRTSSLEVLAPPSAKPRWTESDQQAFETKLTRITAAANLPFCWVENPEVLGLFARFLPSARVPSRKVLTNRIIPAELAIYRSNARACTAGAVATGQADGWSGGNFHHYIGFMMTANREVCLLHKSSLIVCSLND